MNFLEERIVKDGIVKEGNVLKVDSFLNHQMDIDLFNRMGAEFKKRFAGKNINKIVTIEASGIGIACVAAMHFNVPVVFAKKAKSINIDGDMYIAEVESFTHKCKNQVIVSKKFLSENDHVLIIDDFLANGCALQGLISIINQAGGTVEGIGIAIEKGFQNGGNIIRNLGYQLESLAIVDSMDAAATLTKPYFILYLLLYIPAKLIILSRFIPLNKKNKKKKPFFRCKKRLHFEKRLVFSI